jgi:FMN phosphatase YigB (HAD superfamily)
VSGQDRATDASLVFLLDVDNTLLDNDRLKDDLAGRLREIIGVQQAERFWEIYEQVRGEQGFVDYPRTVRLLAQETRNPGLQTMLMQLLDTWDFRSYLYPHTLDTIAYLESLGTAVILSDGDSVFQPLKIKRSGLSDAVDGRVLVYVHKENELPAVFSLYPADHYVAVDDKPRIVSSLEKACPATFTTILVKQGKYADAGPFSPPPDYVVGEIGDLRYFSRQQFLSGQYAAISRGLSQS